MKTFNKIMLLVPAVMVSMAVISQKSEQPIDKAIQEANAKYAAGQQATPAQQAEMQRLADERANRNKPVNNPPNVPHKIAETAKPVETRQPLVEPLGQINPGQTLTTSEVKPSAAEQQAIENDAVNKSMQGRVNARVVPANIQPVQTGPLNITPTAVVDPTIEQRTPEQQAEFNRLKDEREGKIERKQFGHLSAQSEARRQSTSTANVGINSTQPVAQPVKPVSGQVQPTTPSKSVNAAVAPNGSLPAGGIPKSNSANTIQKPANAPKSAPVVTQVPKVQNTPSLTPAQKAEFQRLADERAGKKIATDYTGSPSATSSGKAVQQKVSTQSQTQPIKAVTPVAPGTMTPEQQRLRDEREGKVKRPTPGMAK